MEASGGGLSFGHPPIKDSGPLNEGTLIFSPPVCTRRCQKRLEGNGALCKCIQSPARSETTGLSPPPPKGVLVVNVELGSWGPHPPPSFFKKGVSDPPSSPSQHKPARPPVGSARGWQRSGFCGGSRRSCPSSTRTTSPGLEVGSNPLKSSGFPPECPGGRFPTPPTPAKKYRISQMPSVTFSGGGLLAYLSAL